MLKKKINIDKYKWTATIYFDINSNNISEVMEALFRLYCPAKDAQSVYNLIINNVNTGFTYTNYSIKQTITCIGRGTNVEETVNTIFHEVYHIQDHIARYYSFNTDLELPAYLSGYIGANITNVLLNFLK